MNARDLVTLNLNSKGGSEVVADLNRISAATKELEKQNKELRISKNKTTAEISLARKEVSNYTSQISKQEKAIAKASTENENFRKKIQELESAGKKGSSQWQKYTDRLDENVNKMAASRAEISRLTSSQTEARKRLSDLQTQNKAYQSQLDKNSQSIAANKEAYNKAAMTMKTTEMSYNQLSRRQSELRRELNSTSKSLNPKEWNTLNRQLLDVEKQMGRVAAGSQGVSDKFRNMGQTAVKAFGLMVGYAVLQFFAQLSSAVVDFVKEGIQMAAIAEGVRNAFTKLNQPDLLVNLRKETKGLINDFLLMQSAVKADKFNIPVEKLGSLLKFAQQRAQETGDSVDYMVTSIINGIGRKSSLILDNLGISATRLQDEVGKAGDFTKGVINIVNEELEKQGDLALTSAEKAQQSAAKWQNAQLKVGNSLKWLKDRYNELSGAAADAISAWIETPLSEQLKKDQNEMNRLVSILDNHNISQELRKNIIKQLNANYPELLKYIDLEVDGLEALKNKLIQVNKEYDLKFRLASVDEKKIKPIQEERNNLLEKESNLYDDLANAVDAYQSRAAKSAKMSQELADYIKSGAKDATNLTEVFEKMPKRGNTSRSFGADTWLSDIKKYLAEIKKIPGELEENEKKRVAAFEKHVAPLYKEQDQLLEQEKAAREALLGKRRIELGLALNSIAVTDQEKEAKEKSVKQLKLWVDQLEKQVIIDKDLVKEEKDLIKEKEAQLEIAKKMPGETKAEIKARNQAVKSIEDEIKRLKELGIEKEKGTGDKYISKQRKEMNTYLLNLENNYKDQLNILRESKYKQELTESQYNEKVIEADQRYYDMRISYLSEFQKKVQQNATKGSGVLSRIGKQMTEQFGSGNVDLLARPLVDAAKLVEKGWSDAGDGIATVFSSQYGITDKSGKEIEVLVTPILPNGDVLSQSELEDYVDNVLQGADDLLSSDTKGLIISVDVDPSGKAGDDLHKLQEKYYDLKQSLSAKPDSKLSEDITKDIIETNTKLLEVNNNLDQARLSSLNKAYEKEYQYAELSRNAQIRLLQEKNLSEEEYAAGLEYIDLVYADRRLAIQRQFGEDLAYLELSNSELKEKTVIESNEAIVQSEIDTYNRRRDIRLNARDNNVQVRDQYNISTPEERKKREIQALDDLYAAKQISAETHEKALQAIDLKYEQERFQVREQYGITSIWERYDAEKDILAQQYAEGLLTEEEHQKALNQLKLKYAIESAQTVASIAGTATDAVSALQQAETDNLDAEYDTRIAAAEGNAAEVERLENEKAQKKLDIEKKYADVQFAVRAAEIIANTAVAIMQGYAQLGPIGGSIAAAFLGLTGAAQLASANAERQKVKNMTIKGSTAASTGERFMLPGKEEGGSIDVTRSQDGKNFTAAYQPGKRGYVSRPTVIVGEGAAGQSREWVASNGAVSNPTIRPIIDLIDHEQRRGTVRTVDMNQRIRQRMAGFETGGFINQVATSPANNQPVVVDRGVDPLMVEMYQFLKQLRSDGIPAIVGIDELDARQNYKNSITQNYIRP